MDSEWVRAWIMRFPRVLQRPERLLNGPGSGLKMDSGADCWFYSGFIGVPGGAIHDSSRRGLENVVFPLVLHCFSRDQSVSQP